MKPAPPSISLDRPPIQDENSKSFGSKWSTADCSRHGSGLPTILELKQEKRGILQAARYIFYTNPTSGCRIWNEDLAVVLMANRIKAKKLLRKNILPSLFAFCC